MALHFASEAEADAWLAAHGSKVVTASEGPAPSLARMTRPADVLRPPRADGPTRTALRYLAQQAPDAHEKRLRAARLLGRVIAWLFTTIVAILLGVLRLAAAVIFMLAAIVGLANLLMFLAGRRR